jgi:ribonuclease R
MSERIGEEMEAVVTGVESFGLFVQGIDLPAEGLVHVTSLDDDYYRFDRASHTLAGHRSGNTYRLGDLVRVSVYRVDLDRRELDFRLVARAKRRANGPPKRPKCRPAGKTSKSKRSTKTVKPRKKGGRRKG